MEAQQVPISGLDAIAAHPCRYCREARPVIDSRYRTWILCRRLRIPVSDRIAACPLCDPDQDDPQVPANLAQDPYYRPASEEEALRYAVQLATTQTLSVLRRWPDSWAGAWSIREHTGLEYELIDAALAGLLARGEVEEKTIPVGTLYRLVAREG